MFAYQTGKPILASGLNFYFSRSGSRTVNDPGYASRTQVQPGQSWRGRLYHAASMWWGLLGAFSNTKYKYCNWTSRRPTCRIVLFCLLSTTLSKQFIFLWISLCTQKASPLFQLHFETAPLKMAPYEGTCHCGKVAWTVELPESEQGHILWYARSFKPSQQMSKGNQPFYNLNIPRARRNLY